MSEQEDLFDIPDTVPYQPHSGTSKEAAEEIRENAGTLRANVLNLLRQISLTDEEIQIRLGMNPSTERPRRIELVQSGKVRDSGITRRTRSRRSATVWEVTNA